MKKLSELPLSELLGLYNHYMSVKLVPTRDQYSQSIVDSWLVINKVQFKAVESEINERLKGIDFES